MICPCAGHVMRAMLKSGGLRLVYERCGSCGRCGAWRMHESGVLTLTGEQARKEYRRRTGSVTAGEEKTVVAQPVQPAIKVAATREAKAAANCSATEQKHGRNSRK